MSTVPVSPILLEDVLFKVDADDYAEHVSKVELVPSRGTVSWRGMTKGSSHNRATRGSWVANVDHAQDWSTPNSLSRYLFDHAGEFKTVTFEPVAGGTSWTVEAQIVESGVGGAVDTIAVGSVALPCQGRPVPTYVPAAP